MGHTRRPCLFLDRDGVVIEWMDYPSQASQVKVQPMVVELIRTAQKNGWWVAIVSNQSGLGRGYFSWEQYECVHQEMLRQLAQEKVWVDQIKMAPFYRATTEFEFMTGKGLRKPRPGMIHQVCLDLNVDRTRSIMIGDNVTDMMAGAVAQIQHLCLLQVDRSSSKLNLNEKSTGSSGPAESTGSASSAVVAQDENPKGSGKEAFAEDIKAWREWPLNNRTKYGLAVPICKDIKDLGSMMAPLITPLS
jgi:histidinol-phosphate phosphatase family protein